MSERGSALPLSLGLIAIGVIVLVLALDVILYSAAVREAAFAADVGSEAGATGIDVEQRYGGALVLDPAVAAEAATQAASAARPRPGRVVDAQADPDQVCVTVTQPFRGRLVTVASTISVTACAAPAEG